MLDNNQLIFGKCLEVLCNNVSTSHGFTANSRLFQALTKPHRNNLHKATPVDAARREPTLTLERFLGEEDPWKRFLVVGPEKVGGTKETSCCFLRDKDMSAGISEGINRNEFTGD